jgi:two-component system, OmpR family, sensor kinase
MAARTPSASRIRFRGEQNIRGDAKIGGSGLGLSIIKAIADRTGMTLNVISPRPISQEGVGVQVKLPIA